MLKNKKIMLALALPILLFVGYSMAKPKPVVKQKIKGTIYALPQPFLLNLSDGRYVKLTVALELAPGQSDGAAAGEGGSSSSEDSAGTLPEEPLVREIVTNAVTNQNGEALVSSASRKAIREKIRAAIQKQTDVKVDAVLFPDLTVQ
jgi:flagellar protein FliL